MIPREVYFIIGAVIGLVLLAFGVKHALDTEFAKGEAAGSAKASAACSEQVDKIEQASDNERRRLSKIAQDLGLAYAKTETARRALSDKLIEESDHDIEDHPAPAAVCDWTDERVRIINDAARGIGTGGKGKPGSSMPGAVPEPAASGLRKP